MKTNHARTHQRLRRCAILASALTLAPAWSQTPAASPALQELWRSPQCAPVELTSEAVDITLEMAPEAAGMAIRGTLGLQLKTSPSQPRALSVADLEPAASAQADPRVVLSVAAVCSAPNAGSTQAGAASQGAPPSSLVSLATKSGSIHATWAVSLAASTRSGAIFLGVGPGAAVARAQSRTGPIEVRLEHPASAAIELATSGEITSDYSIDIDYHYHREPAKTASVKIGGAGAAPPVVRLLLYSRQGAIRMLRPQSHQE